MLKFEDFSFRYEVSENEILSNLNFEVNKGEVCLIFGESGCGKSTLLRCIKPYMARKGVRSGRILFEGKDVTSLSDIELVNIGYLSQDIEEQIVTDKVWHELAFGLENLGLANEDIRLRCGEMATYFGIEEWYEKDTATLSMGQKQLLNLASIMIMKPELLILDEPTSTLDPVAASEIMERIMRLNRDFGTTIVIVMHELEEVYQMATKVVLLDKEVKVLSPENMAGQIIKEGSRHTFALPAAVRLFDEYQKREKEEYKSIPITIADGKLFVDEKEEVLETYYNGVSKKQDSYEKDGKPLLELKNVYFKYNKDSDLVLEDMNLKVYNNQIYTIMGGNGSGKSTALSLISRLKKPLNGKILVDGQKIDKISDKDLYGHILGVVPQNPRNLFSTESVREEFKNVDKDELDKLISLFEIGHILDLHPFDISGGQMQKVALIKVLLKKPEILILDEPTKGLDAYSKKVLEDYLLMLKSQGMTILIVSHDVEFAAHISDRIGLLFNKRIISEGDVKTFFVNNYFYTTVLNRICQEHFNDVILLEDLFGSDKVVSDGSKSSGGREIKKKNKINHNSIKNNILLFALGILLAFGISKTFADQKYFAASALLVLISMGGVTVYFEKKKISIKRLVIIAVLIAIGVVGRIMFYMVPGFKPIGAISIIAGASLDPFSGFLCGSLMILISNMFFGQGAWTAFQMFGFGLLGFLAGLLGMKVKNHTSKTFAAGMALYGFLGAFILYGFIMNFFTSLTSGKAIEETLIINIISGIPFDFIHGLATAFFIILIGRPIFKRINRVKIKYEI